MLSQLTESQANKEAMAQKMVEMEKKMESLVSLNQSLSEKNTKLKDKESKLVAQVSELLATQKELLQEQQNLRAVGTKRKLVDEGGAPGTECRRTKDVLREQHVNIDTVEVLAVPKRKKVCFEGTEQQPPSGNEPEMENMAPTTDTIGELSIQHSMLLFCADLTQSRSSKWSQDSCR